MSPRSILFFRLAGNFSINNHVIWKQELFYFFLFNLYAFYFLFLPYCIEWNFKYYVVLASVSDLGGNNLFKRHSVLFKHSWRHLLHAKKAFIFGRIQNVHRDIWTMPTHLPNPTCHYHVSYQGNKGLLLAISSQNTNTGAIKCDNILIY